MKKIIILVLFVSSVFSISCEKENEIIQADEKIKLSEISVKDGRLYFPNKATFQDFYYDLDKRSENDVAEILENKFYKNDFFSLKPIVNEKTQFEIKRHIDKFKTSDLLIKGNGNKEIVEDDVFDHFDDLEEILGEDIFQSFLNDNAEIQVGEKIYKYTDKGILIVNAEFINEIYSFMSIHNVNSLSDFENLDVSGEYPSFNTNGGMKQVTENVESYVSEKHAPVNNPTLPDYYNPFNNGGSGSTINSTTSDEDIINLANNLESCSGSSPFLGNLFGTTKVCVKKFGDAQRVKVKYYSVDFYLVFAIGIKVKHQHKGWLIWTNQDTDEMALGINSVTWYFDHSNVFSNTTNTSITNYYTHDGKLFSSFNAYSNAIYIGPNRPLPPMPFADSVDLMIEWAGSTLGANPTEEQVRQFFYSNIYQKAKSIMNGLGKPMNSVGVIINQNGQTIVQYYDFNKRCSNCTNLEKVFDWGVVTPKINYTFDSAGDNHFGFSGIKFDFKHPEITHLNIYGMVKRSGNWYGYRMIF